MGTGMMKRDREHSRKHSITHVPSFDPKNARNQNGTDKDSKFFFASEMKTTYQQRPQSLSKNSTYYSYANHDLKLSQSQNSSFSSVGSRPNKERSHPIFFHANGTPDLSCSPGAHLASSIQSNFGTFSPIDSVLSPKSNPLASSTTESSVEIQNLSEPQSPVKMGSAFEQSNELALNARRERKVLDLEITNSSLAAINRTLEREMRKQTAELRRFKRLSRSVRLPLTVSGPSHVLLDGKHDRTLLSEMQEDLNEEEDSTVEESEEISDDELSTDSPMSPSAIAKSHLRHRTSDERKLQLDLAKHQQLLDSSREMNQTIKRCLCLTEVMIVEGMKALQHKEEISDVEFGGRVLTPEEVEDPEDEGISEFGLQILKEVRKSVLNERRLQVVKTKARQDISGINVC